MIKVISTLIDNEIELVGGAGGGSCKCEVRQAHVDLGFVSDSDACINRCCVRNNGISFNYANEGWSRC